LIWEAGGVKILTVLIVIVVSSRTRTGKNRSI